MKKDSIRTTRSERERWEYAAKLAEGIAVAFECGQDVDIYARILDGPPGAASGDSLELLILHVQEIFAHEGWTLPPVEKWGWPSVKKSPRYPSDWPRDGQWEAIHKAAEKMRSGGLSRENFCLGTTRLIDNVLTLGDSPLILGLIVYYRLLFARRIRKTEPGMAINLVAHCGLMLARMVVLLDSERKRRGAINKMKRDPVQAAKARSFELWQERRAGRHPKLRTNEQFATECTRRWPDDLKSAKVILGWCTEWNKAAKARKLKTAS